MSPESRAALQIGFENLERGHLRLGDSEHREKEGPPRGQDEGRRGGFVPGGWLPEVQQPQWGGEVHMSAVQTDFWESLFHLTYDRGWSQKLNIGAYERRFRQALKSLGRISKRALRVQSKRVQEARELTTPGPCNSQGQY